MIGGILQFCSDYADAFIGLSNGQKYAIVSFISVFMLILTASFSSQETWVRKIVEAVLATLMIIGLSFLVLVVSVTLGFILYRSFVTPG